MQWGESSARNAFDSAFDYQPGPSMEEDLSSPNKHDSSTASNGYSSDQQSEADEPTYNVEHLATFSVGRAHNIVDPSDGLNKLWQMEKRTGIWTQKMQIRLSRHGLVIVDYENGDVVERFPMHLISSPMAYAGADPKEPYNNILIFVVKEDLQRKNPMNPSEMHIFQCVQVAAQIVVEDLKSFMSGKLKSTFSNGKSELHLANNASSGAGLLPPPPNAPAPEPPSSPLQPSVAHNGVSVRQQVSRFNASNKSGSEMLSTSYVTKNQERLELRSAYNNGHQAHRDSLDETSSTSSEKYEKEVGILNHCFDDIEQFIAWLQSAAAAYRELERRRKTRKNKKSKDHGDGMLSMRAKPPPERDFVDVFQKFKLSFNLLAKLKAHIHDPNAPELVHFLFTPLALIVDASRDSNYGPNLAAKVVSPLLTREAVELLANCLTSKESDLWNSLGDSWIVSRDRWKGYVVPYHPSFRDGYSPEYPFNEDRERAEMAALAAASVVRTRRDEAGRGGYSGGGGTAAGGGGGGSANHAGYYYNGDDPLMEPMMMNQLAVEAERHGGGGGGTGRRQSPDERTASPDAHHHSLVGYNVGRGGVDMQSDISADSIERYSAGTSLFASASMGGGGGGAGGGGDPHRQLERHQRQWLDDLRLRDAKVVQVIFPRTANNDKELSVFRGEFLEVLDDSRKWWKARNIRGQVAHVPHTIVTHLDDHDAIFNNPLYSRGKDNAYQGQDSPNRSTDGSVTGNDLRISSPRLHSGGPPMPPPAPADLIRKERQEESTTTMSTAKNVLNTAKNVSCSKNSKGNVLDNVDLQEELKRTLGRSKAHKDLLVRRLASKPRMPPICINESSSAADVRVWLVSKGFDERITNMFDGVDGEMMFLLSRERLEKTCGVEDGSRLDSQLKLQKSISGFKTLRGRELEEILEARRRKSEECVDDDGDSSESTDD